MECILIRHVYSTALIRPDELAEAPNKTAGTSARFFVTPLGGIGQGFHRSLTPAETNILESGRIGSQRVRLRLMSWDIFDAESESGLQAGRNGGNKKSLPLECRPAGLLVYGTLKVWPSPMVCLDSVPLTTGVPYGSIADDLLLRGGLIFGGTQAPQVAPTYGFAVTLSIRPGYRPVAPVGVRICLHLDNAVSSS